VLAVFIQFPLLPTPECKRYDIPVILASGFINIEIEKKSTSSGITILLSKPVNMYQLASAIGKALNK
jgi:FixJ family two-component response regulator